MEHHNDLALGQEPGVFQSQAGQPQVGQSHAATSAPATPASPRSRIKRRVGLIVGAIAALGIL
ncbi:MAG TPA: hypothetical protein VKC56_03790, partial [Gallionellaceae bacterium]|nr:hypothetical protein [Gallionellaceae bacterium]